MRKIVKVCLLFFLLVSLSACVNTVKEKDLSTKTGKFFEIGSDSPAWGGSKYIFCNNGDIYSLGLGDVQFASYLGTAKFSDMKEIEKLLGPNSIEYQQYFDDPQAFDDEHTSFLNYDAVEPKRELDADAYRNIAHSINLIIDENKQEDAVAVVKTKNSQKVVQWRDSAVLSYSQLLGDRIDQRIYLADLNEEQKIIINRMNEDYKKLGLNTTHANYLVEEDSKIYIVDIYNEFFSIGTYPNKNYKLEDFIKVLPAEKEEIVKDNYKGSVPVEKVTDSDIVKNIKDNKLGRVRINWQEGDQKMASEYDLRLGYKQVEASEICK